MNEIPVLRIDPDAVAVDSVNIRKTTNPRYAELRSSIESDQGAHLFFFVSRIDDNHPWQVVAGSGTRLAIAQELKAKYRDEESNPFEFIRCMPVVWGSVLDRTLSSARENMNRGDTSFAEQCDALHELRARWETEIEEDTGTDAEFTAYLKASGIPISKTAYLRCKYARSHLLPYLPALFYRGRGRQSVAVQLNDERIAVTRLLASPPPWMGTDLGLPAKTASKLYDTHFRAMAKKHDAVDLETARLIATVRQTLSQALSVSTSDFRMALKGEEPKTKASIPNPILSAANSPESPDAWEGVTSELGVPNTLKDGWLFLAKMPLSQSSEILALLRSSTQSKDDTNEQPAAS